MRNQKVDEIEETGAQSEGVLVPAPAKNGECFSNKAQQARTKA